MIAADIRAFIGTRPRIFQDGLERRFADLRRLHNTRMAPDAPEREVYLRQREALISYFMGAFHGAAIHPTPHKVEEFIDLWLESK